MHFNDKNWLSLSKVFSRYKAIPLFKGWLCIFIVIFDLLPSMVFPQINLVHNGSYEDTVCSAAYQIYCAEYWYIVQITPDYYTTLNGSAPNTVVGFQWPHNGNAFAGEAVYGGVADPNKREYMGVGLTESLKSGKHYCCTFWVNRPNASGTAVDRLGVYFSTDSIITISSCCELPYTPQVENTAGNIITDTMNWTSINGEFVAVGGEKFMTVGNFKNDAMTQTFGGAGGANNGYYLFDDFSLVLVPDVSYPKDFANAGGDTIICEGESKQLGTPAIAGCHYSWQPTTGLDNDTLAQPIATPSQTTTYILTVQTYSTPCRAGIILTDTVTVFIDSCMPPPPPEQPIEAYNIFTPNHDGLNETFYVNNLPANSRLIVFNRWGSKVYESTNYNNNWDGGKVPDGTYYYLLTLPSKVVMHGFVELRR